MTHADTIAVSGFRASDRAIAVWLLTLCGLVFAMVVLGGVTRLTHSGLSMVEWRPLMGWLPPLSEAEWQRVFAKYQQYPEYQKINFGMTLAEFKGIFWFEFLHRVLGRVIGPGLPDPVPVVLAARPHPWGAVGQARLRLRARRGCRGSWAGTW